MPNHELELCSVRRDEEIIKKVEEQEPAVVAIDAPLSFYGKPFRDCDFEMRKYCSILPLTFKGNAAAYGARHKIDGDYQREAEIQY